MTVDLSPIDENLLAEIANMHGMPKGAFNVRKDGELVGRHSSAYIDISTKTDNPGIDIRIADGTKGETVYIPVIVTKSGLKDVVYNTFYVGENCDITIIAGCGIHNDSPDASEHDGIHSFYLGKNRGVRYVEKHYGEGDGSGERILNPTTNVYMEEGSSCEMEMVQLRGVTSTVRDTNAELGADAKLVLTEKLLTHGNQTAISNMKVELKGEGSSVQVISRSVAQDDSVQVFNPLVIGECACRGHGQCGAIIMGNAKVKAIPGIEAASDRFMNPDDADATKTACAGAQAVCVSVKREKKTEQPPRLYDLTTLQREANRLFGFTAKQTLDYAQQLYEKKLLTYPRTDSQYLTDDMQPTAESIVSGLWPLLSFAAGLDIAPQFGRVLNSKKVSDHHAIIPTMEFVQKGFDGLTEGEKKLLSLVCCKLLCAVAAPHVYEAVTTTFTCAGNEFTAKGKTILTPGWKEIERRFKASFKTDADEDAPELARELPEITEGQTFDPVEASITEHFTTPPKPYTEDTLLSAMERAGAEDMPEDAERQGLGTPATRASILEKLVQMGLVERKGKQLLPTKDGHNLVCVLPEVLTSPQLTAEWETKLTAIAKGEADPEGFMVGIEEMTRSLISRYSQISEDAQKLFQTERVVIGKCPRCGEAVYEGKKNYYCGNRACQFVMWKNDRFFEERGKTFTPKIAAALLKDGKAKVKGLRSMKTGKTYDGTVLLADTGGKYVNYRVEKRS